MQPIQSNSQLGEPRLFNAFSAKYSKMRIALIFLSAMVVFSQTQYLRARSRFQWSLPQRPQRVYDRYQPISYEDLIEDYSAHPQFRPTKPINYYEMDDMNSDFADNHDETEFDDIQSRIKSSNRYKPSPLDPINPRFLFNLLGQFTITDPVKTATFTYTSHVNITSVQSCISSSLFANGSSNVICRRKRDLLHFLAMKESDEVNQFDISPSETLPLDSTNLPQMDLLMGDDDQTNYNGVRSSLNEDNLDDIQQGSNNRAKRFLISYALGSSTVTTYRFRSTTITKAVNIATVGTVSPATGPLLCRPSGYVIC